MDLADGHIILVAEACQALDMQLLVVSFPPPLNWKESRPKREEMFKLRDTDGLQKFYELSTKSD